MGVDKMEQKLQTELNAVLMNRIDSDVIASTQKKYEIGEIWDMWGRVGVFAFSTLNKVDVGKDGRTDILNPGMLTSGMC